MSSATIQVHEVRPRKDHRGVAAISDALPFIIALIVGSVLVFILLYLGSFLVTRRQDARFRSPFAQRQARRRSDFRRAAIRSPVVTRDNRVSPDTEM